MTVPSRPTRRIPLRLLAFGVVAVIAFGLGFLAFGVEQARILVKQYGYYTIALTFTWAVFATCRAVAGAAPLRNVAVRERTQAAGLILACTAVVVLTTPIGYKILFDEMVLQATAATMQIYREVGTVVRAYWVDGVFVPFDTYLDKRPFFYPFLVSLVHDVTGYRESNAWLVNLMLLPVVLGQWYLIARKLAGHGAGMLAALSFGTLSALAQSATGSGMEMLNLAMLGGVMLLGLWYLEAPDERRLSALVLAAVLLAQTRYESSLFVIPVALIGIEGWRRAGRVILSPAAIAAPALLIPYAVHNTYLSGTPTLWELRENVESRFGTENLVDNVSHAVRYLFGMSSQFTNSFWLSAAGFLSAAFAIRWLWAARREWRMAPPAVFVLLATALAIVGNLMVLMFYYWGQLDDPTVTRLGLPFCGLLALTIAYAVQRLSAWRPHLHSIAAGGAVLAYLATGVVANEQHSKRNTLNDELVWQCEFVESLPPGDRLIIANKSTLPWMARRFPAVSIDHARRRVDALRVQLTEHAFREILVVQEYRPTEATGEFRLVPAERLPEWWKLEAVAEKRFGAHLVRISRLLQIGQPDTAAADTGDGGTSAGGNTAETE